MALDTYLTKSILVNSAATFTPVGPISSSSGNVAYWDTATRLPIGGPMALVLRVPQAAAGTTPTITVTLQSDDNTAFSSPVTRFTSTTMTGTAGPTGNGKGVFLLGYVTGPMERYLRAQVTAGGTTPNYGTVEVALTPDWDDRALV